MLVNQASTILVVISSTMYDSKLSPSLAAGAGVGAGAGVAAGC